MMLFGQVFPLASFDKKPSRTFDLIILNEIHYLIIPPPFPKHSVTFHQLHQPRFLLTDANRYDRTSVNTILTILLGQRRDGLKFI